MAGERITVGVRPEHFTDAGTATLPLTIEIIEHLGGETFAYASYSHGEVITIRVQHGRELKSGQAMEAKFDPKSVLLFDSSGQRIR